MKTSALYVMLTQVVIALTPLIATPYLTRTIGPEGLGIYSYSFSVASGFVVLGQLGVQLYGRREIARCGADRRERTRVFWGLGTLLIRANILMVTVFIVLALTVSSDGAMRLALLLQLPFLISGGIDIGWLFHGVEKFRLLAFGTVLTRLASLLAIFVFVDGEEDALVYVLVMSASFFLGSLIPWMFARKFIGRPLMKEWWSFSPLRHMWKFYLPALAVQASPVVGVVIISTWTSLAELGNYDVAFRLSRAPIAFITALGVVLLPRVTRLVSAGNQSDSKDLLRRGTAATMFLASAFAATFIGVAETFIPLFAGDGFQDAVPVLMILSVSLLVVAWGNVLRTQIILPNGYDGVYATSLICGFVVMVVLSLLLVRPWGIVGVAIAFATSEAFVAIYQAVAVRKDAAVSSQLVIALKYVLAGGVSVLIMWAVSALPLTGWVLLGLQIIAGAIVYVIGAILAESLTSDRVVLSELQRFARKSGRIRSKIDA